MNNMKHAKSLAKKSDNIGITLEQKPYKRVKSLLTIYTFAKKKKKKIIRDVKYGSFAVVFHVLITNVIEATPLVCVV